MLKLPEEFPAAFLFPLKLHDTWIHPAFGMKPRGRDNVNYFPHKLEKFT